MRRLSVSVFLESLCTLKHGPCAGVRSSGPSVPKRHLEANALAKHVGHLRRKTVWRRNHIGLRLLKSLVARQFTSGAVNETYTHKKFIANGLDSASDDSACGKRTRDAVSRNIGCPER